LVIPRFGQNIINVNLFVRNGSKFIVLKNGATLFDDNRTSIALHKKNKGGLHHLKARRVKMFKKKVHTAEYTKEQMQSAMVLDSESEDEAKEDTTHERNNTTMQIRKEKDGATDATAQRQVEMTPQNREETKTSESNEGEEEKGDALANENTNAGTEKEKMMMQWTSTRHTTSLVTQMKTHCARQ